MTYVARRWRVHRETSAHRLLRLPIPEPSQAFVAANAGRTLYFLAVWEAVH